MRIGVPTEIKDHEYRVALSPAGVRELASRGHDVFIQAGAGEGSAITDDAFTAQGAEVVPRAEDVFEAAELIVKVKEPQAEEVELLSDRHLLFAYLHLAPAPELTSSLMASGATCVAYETVEPPDGTLPLLAPMSEIAGKLATQAGASSLEKARGGRGALLGGAPGVSAARVLVIGGGVVGFNAAQIGLGMQAQVSICDRDIDRLRELDALFGGRLDTVYASSLGIEEQLAGADVVIGAVLVKGSLAPKVVTRSQLGLMRPGAVLVDVSIDQGGCIETSKPTTHSDPTFVVDDVVHYCVANMPGAVPATSTAALTNATLPYVAALADHGVEDAVRADPALERGVNIVAGQVTLRSISEPHGLPYVPARQALGIAAESD